MMYISIHTLTLRVTPARHSGYGSVQDFNPHPHTEGDGTYTFTYFCATYFNPHPHTEGDSSLPFTSSSNFNPHPHTEGDGRRRDTVIPRHTFQSTPSH